MGALLGVSAQTVYNWEAGKARPRQQQLAAIAAVRKLGKRDVKAKLGGRKD
jgi:DNA-binding transcriptional regulator YiaG